MTKIKATLAILITTVSFGASTAAVASAQTTDCRSSWSRTCK